jgi:serine protease
MLLSGAALAATLFLPLAAHTPLAQSTAPAASVGADRARVIVKYRADSPLLKKQAMTATGRRILQSQALGNRIGIALTPGIGITDRSHVVFATGIDSKTLAARISAESDIEYAVPDQRKHIVAAPNDSYYASGPAVGASSGGPVVGQWYLKPPGAAGTAANTAPSSINAEQAWGVTTGSSSIVVADIDTGLRFDHPDLQGGNVLQGYDMISADSDGSFTTANDCCGRHAVASDPGDWVTQQESSGSGPLNGCAVGNSSWHGTQTGGLLGAATNNSVGIASVGYGNVKLLPVRVLGKCGGFDSDIEAGMLWAAGLAVPGVPTNTTPARVLNMSLGSTGNCPADYVDTINQVLATGAAIVVAAGNSGGNSVGVPGNCPGVIAVTGLRDVGDKVGFSDLGPEIAISSPGGNCVNATGACLYPIMTTSNAGTTTPVVGAVGGIYTDAFNASLGTSFSTPLVTGTVALMFSVQSTLTPAQVLAALKASARAFPTTGGTAGTTTCVAPTASSNEGECYCAVGVCGAGMLDAHAAVLAAMTVQASISDSTASPTAGSPVVLTSTSVVGTGATITRYVWVITNAGTTGVAITSGQGTPTLTVMPTAAGTFTASLTVTDSLGNTSTAGTTVNVAAAAQAVQASISDSTASPTAGSPVVLTSTSVVGTGVTITRYVWAITNAGTTGVTITSGQGTPTLTVMPPAAGTFTASLTATDSLGNTSTASMTVNVVAAGGGGGGSSGGGALGGGWLALLLAAVLALAAANRAERRRTAALSESGRPSSRRR